MVIVKKVTKEDVEKYFENAKTVKNAYNKTFVFSGVLRGFWGSFRDKESSFTLYDEKNGFAEIIEYKN